MDCRFYWGFTWRHAEHNWSFRFIDSLSDTFDFLLVGGIRPAEIVDLNEVHSPGSNELKDAIVIFLSARLGHIHSVHVLIPRTAIVAISDVGCLQFRPQNGQAFFNGLAGNASHQVDSKLQTLAMGIFGHCSKAFSILCRWKLAYRWEQSTIPVHCKDRLRVIVESFGVRFVPLNVYNRVLPPVCFQLLAHHIHIGFK